MAEVLAHMVRAIEDPRRLEGREVVIVAAEDDKLVLMDKRTLETIIVGAGFECEREDCSGQDDPYTYLTYSVSGDDDAPF